MENETLSTREIQVLEAIVRNYILSATPTGSRSISKLKGFDFSPATIRNVMGDLEEQGYITQPHTSAGRIPTDKGYRFYVNHIMHQIDLPEETKQQIRSSLVTIDQSDLHLVMEAASKALSRTTNQLGVILAPKLREAVLKHLNIISIDSSKYIMNVAVDSGFVKSMVVELKTDIPYERLDGACRILTSKFKGKTLHDICEADDSQFKDITPFELGVIRLLVPSLKKMAESEEPQSIYAQGETNVILQPEFFDRERIGAIIEILEEKRLLMHLFEQTYQSSMEKGGVLVTIGGENQDGQLQSFSIIKTTYRVGNMVSSLGVIGPKRMHYPYLISAVQYTARLLGELYI